MVCWGVTFRAVVSRVVLSSVVVFGAVWGEGVSRALVCGGVGC